MLFSSGNGGMLDLGCNYEGFPPALMEDLKVESSVAMWNI